MFADYEYYTESFGGSKIKDEAEYKYLAQQADRYIMRYTSVVSNDTKDCEGALAEYLQGNNITSGITSETIPSAYSVTYNTKNKDTFMSEINAILELYLGDKFSAVGIVKLVG